MIQKGKIQFSFIFQMLLRSVFNSLAIVLKDQRRGSDKLFKKALEINQQDVKAYFNRGAC